jgi:hypothetical protein
VETSLRAIFNGSSALYGETRIEIFTAYEEENRTGPAKKPLNTTISEKTDNLSFSPTKTAIAVSIPSTPPVREKEPLTPAPKGFSSWIFDMLDHLFSVLFSIVGDTAPLDRNSVYPGPVDSAGLDTVTGPYPNQNETGGISQGTDYPPGENTGLEVTVPIIKYNNASSTIVGSSGPEVVNHTSKTVQRKPVTHSGGIYITSYPADVELRVDTKKIDIVLPAVVYGLKEGIHNVEVRQLSENDKIITSQSLRTWVYADAITTVNFDLVAGYVPRKIRISSLDNTSNSFTVNGYYPIRKSPVEVEFTRPDDFFTILRDGAYLSYRPFSMVSEENSITIPPSNPQLYNLTVESSPPGGEIFVDGTWSGFTTPAVIPDLSSGLHRVIVSLPGYIPGESIVEIPITDGPLVTKPAVFVLDTYAFGPVTVESIPPGADILVDGYVTGEITPHTFGYLPIGIHQVSFRRNGETRTIEVNIKPGTSHREVVMFHEKGSDP